MKLFFHTSVYIVKTWIEDFGPFRNCVRRLNSEWSQITSRWLRFHGGICYVGHTCRCVRLSADGWLRSHRPFGEASLMLGTTERIPRSTWDILLRYPFPYDARPSKGPLFSPLSSSWFVFRHSIPRCRRGPTHADKTRQQLPGRSQRRNKTLVCILSVAASGLCVGHVLFCFLSSLFFTLNRSGLHASHLLHQIIAISAGWEHIIKCVSVKRRKMNSLTNCIDGSVYRKVLYFNFPLQRNGIKSTYSE